MRTLLLPLLSIFLFITPTFAANAEATVTRIVDGDTIDIKIGSEKEAIRLIGIDTPESHDNKKARKDSARTKTDLAVITSQGRQASAFLSDLVALNSTLTLEYDVEKRDHYGRILAYAYLPDGRMLNEVIIRSGYASLMTIPPNVRYVEKFKKAYELARTEKVGLWKE